MMTKSVLRHRHSLAPTAVVRAKLRLRHENESRMIEEILLVSQSIKVHQQVLETTCAIRQTHSLDEKLHHHFLVNQRLRGHPRLLDLRSCRAFYLAVAGFRSFEGTQGRNYPALLRILRLS